MAPYDVRTTKVVWEGMLSTARVDEVEMPDGTTAAREVVAHVDAVAVVALTSDDEVVLLRQYRHPLQEYQLELPAGILDVDGESPERAAWRELSEETGMTVTHMRPLLRFANSAGWTDEHTTIFHGEGAHHVERPAGFALEAEEADMEVITIPFGEALTMALHGRFTDAKTLIGLLALAAERRRCAK